MDEELTDNFDGIYWSRLKRYKKPLQTPRRKKSWMCQYGYRVALKN
jgi:hypothetical protein